ncbi:MAG: hypothetical protein ACQESA_03540, partial [Patescibacteria group bacterium]
MLTERHFLLVALSAIIALSAGCAMKPKVVYDDGTPVPSTVYMERNLQTEITVEAYISRII